jgi:hypothetical protein
MHRRLWIVSCYLIEAEQLPRSATRQKLRLISGIQPDFIWNNRTKYPWQRLFHANKGHKRRLPYPFNRIITSVAMDIDAVRCTCKRTISDMQRRQISTTTSWFMRGFLSAPNTSCMSVSYLSISNTYDTNIDSTVTMEIADWIRGRRLGLPYYVLYYLFPEEMVLACSFQLVQSANNVICAYEPRHVSLTTIMGRMERP